MSSLAAAEDYAKQEPAKVVQPAWVRATHWANAFAMILMIMSAGRSIMPRRCSASLFRAASRSVAGSAARCCGTSPRCGC